MSEGKEQKLRKLTKQRIWPSVVFFVLAWMTAFIMVAACAGTFVTYLIETRFEQACTDAKQISGLIGDRLKRGEDLEDIVAFIEESTSYTDAMLIADAKGNVIAGFGEDTVWWDSFEVWEASSAYRIYMDREAKETYFPDEKSIDINPKLIFSQFFAEKHEEVEALDWLSEDVVKIAFWTGSSLDGTEQNVLVKSYIDIYNREAVFIIGLCSIILVMVFLPLLFLFINIITTIRAQRRMTQIIYTDTVTGGKNWFYFENVVAKMLENKKYARKSFLLVDFSLMKYRSYCACYGVKRGETLLEQLDQYLNAHIKKGEYCARFGKSQFVVLLRHEAGKTGKGRIQQWIDELPGVLDYPYAVFHAGIYPIAPVKTGANEKGFQRKNVDVAQLYNNASAARASINDDENSAIEYFDVKMLDEQIWRNKVEANMHEALENEEFQVYLQPKYNPVDDELSGAEALVRWISPTDGFISPGRFIPIFETNGFITKLDDYMISHVAALQAKWLAEGKSVVPISVNVSRAHFSQPDLAQYIAKLVDVYQVPHHLIEIELTESAFFDDKAALLETVNQLKEEGFDVSMDDFGAGYSSLNSLKELPLDVLKLDAEFFRGKFERERGEIVVSEAIHLAKRLNMRIVAEGVEEKEQVDFLAGAGCDMIQGFFYAKPMPVDEFESRMGKDN